mmetsp:Transcript_73433/g.174998  ORF Transcript_73433/g.174998 Transcript_73433/m.174998 type:complete len:256 (-) Transcript_73433:496-1263(-)
MTPVDHCHGDLHHASSSRTFAYHQTDVSQATCDLGPCPSSVGLCLGRGQLSGDCGLCLPTSASWRQIAVWEEFFVCPVVAEALSRRDSGSGDHGIYFWSAVVSLRQIACLGHPCLDSYSGHGLALCRGPCPCLAHDLGLGICHDHGPDPYLYLFGLGNDPESDLGPSSAWIWISATLNAATATASRGDSESGFSCALTHPPSCDRLSTSWTSSPPRPFLPSEPCQPLQPSWWQHPLPRSPRPQCPRQTFAFPEQP